jgi:hypothetical protein
MTTNLYGVPLSSITTYADIYYNATIISTESSANVNISVYNSVGVWQETLYNDTVIFIPGLLLNTTEINGGLLSFNSTGYSTGTYQIQIRYTTNDTYIVYNYFTIREPVLLHSILIMRGVTVNSTVIIGNTVNAIATYTPHDNIYDATVNISVWRDVMGVKVYYVTLLDTTYTFEYGITVTSNDIAGAVNWDTTGKPIGLYYIRAIVGKTGEMTVLTQEWGLTIQSLPTVQMALLLSNVRVYNNSGTTVVASQFTLNETVYINGNAQLNNSLSGVDVVLRLYTEEGWYITLIDKPWDFVGGVSYSLFTINDGTLIYWPSNITGQCFIVLQLKYSGITNSYVTEDFVVELEHVCPEVPETLPIENELLLLAYMIVIPVLMILIIFLIIDRMRSAIQN